MHPTLVRLVGYLVRREATGWQLYGTHDLKAREWVSVEFGPIEEAVLSHAANARRERGDVFGYTDQWIFLPAPTDGPLRIPVLNILWFRDVEPNRVSYQLGVFYPRAEGEPLARVWRFESPEGADSIHGFFHAQPGHALRTMKGDIEVRTADPEIPQGAPTIPVDADGELELFVALLVAVYGLTEAKDLIGGAGDPEVTACLQAMRSPRPAGV
jgi:hypothetical protein